MEAVVYPSKDGPRQETLQLALVQSHQDGEKGLNYLGSDMQQRLGEFVEEYSQAQQRKSQAHVTERQAGKDLTAVVNELKRATRDFVRAVRTAVQRGEAPTTLLDALGLPHSGPVNFPGKRAEWLALGTRLHTGLSTATSPDMLNAIDPARFYSAIMAAQAAAVQHKDADTAYQVCQKECAELRRTANRLIRWVVKDLRQALWAETPSARRRIMRRYGVVFETDEARGENTADADAVRETAASGSETSTGGTGPEEMASHRSMENATTPSMESMRNGQVATQ